MRRDKMTTSWELNSCQVCGKQLAPDDFDNVCSECDEELSEEEMENIIFEEWEDR